MSLSDEVGMEVRLRLAKPKELRDNIRRLIERVSDAEARSKLKDKEIERLKKMVHSLQSDLAKEMMDSGV